MKNVIGRLLALIGTALLIACVAGRFTYVKEGTLAPGKIRYAGVRSSGYGIRPFPQPGTWQTAVKNVSAVLNGAAPCAVWIVGVLHSDRTSCRLEFPPDGRNLDHIVFSEEDKHEAYLDFFDSTGIKVYLQVEPALAPVSELIDLVLDRYGSHSCVVGFGVDVEWHRESERRDWGMPVSDDSACVWEYRVKTHNPDYQLFLKHWDRKWMPKHFRGDILFLSDSQMLKGFDAMVQEFTRYWADHFYPNDVGFQIGYGSDRAWWKPLCNPVGEIGRTIALNIRQKCSIFWVDFTLMEAILSQPEPTQRREGA